MKSEENLNKPIKLGSIVLPEFNNQKILAKYCVNLQFYTDFEHYETQLIGSCSLLECEGRKWAIATLHQIRNAPGLLSEFTNEEIKRVASKICIISPQKTEVALNGEACHFFKDLDNTIEYDSFDLIAFDLTSQADKHPEISSYFFRLDNESIVLTQDKVDHYLLFGCPYSHQQDDRCDEESRHLKMSVQCVAGTPEETPTDDVLGRANAEHFSALNPDGMSGGPCFALCENGSDDLLVKFAGVINRAGNGAFNFINANYVRAFIGKTTERSQS